MDERPKKIGRPTTYNPEFVDIVYDFIDRPLYETVIKQQLSNRGDIVELEVERANMTPTIEGLAIHMRTHTSNIYAWEKRNPMFSEALNALRQKTKEFLNYHALQGNYNSGYAKFFAINATNMKSTEHTVNDNKTVQINITADESNL